MDLREQNFDELKEILIGFREELENERYAFISKQSQLDINFKGVLDDIIYYQSDRDKIYTMLGYDVEIIGRLGLIFSKLNFKHVYDRDTRLVMNLLNGLMRVAHSIQTLFKDIFNQTKLDLLQLRDNEDIKKIVIYLEQFIEIIKDLMLQVKAIIVSVASKINEDSILKELSRVVAKLDSKFNKGVRNIHYLLFDIIELVDFL
ncbi:hypothetical protein BDCR2A_01144 [Borrelia duttonii CR2A]|uniref:Uncharacterized protein n=3 Tax=Borrelia TaxID=138 RepID=W6TKW0_9SPIR|nr:MULTISPECIES: hypothetical protein [Borrelia]ACH93863.1 hypothetical protein BDU_1067 [Borrelia duttonii Ly]ACH95092.1 hypothetical protein BRE_1035 [Borrelia recurrentis A1]ETZ17949.1 hypothetical protein BDCR2A_01144 [Borrelia duttonii CR2A]